MIADPRAQYRFPKSARLLKRRDFQFHSYKRFKTEHFRFVFAPEGQGRMGISLSKKVLKNAVARNRVKRLLKETFRYKIKDLGQVDVHVIGEPSLKTNWGRLRQEDLNQEFGQFVERALEVSKRVVL